MKKTTIPLVFDTGPLFHLAKAGRLKVLQTLTGNRKAIMSDVVHRELSKHPLSNRIIQPLLDTQSIVCHPLETGVEMEAYSRYLGKLRKGSRNKGEASVLALAETLPGIAAIDDTAGRRTARINGIEYRPTLRLLCDAVNEGRLELSLASTVVDDLLASEYWLPLKAGEFERWAIGNGFLQPSPE